MSIEMHDFIDDGHGKCRFLLGDQKLCGKAEKDESHNVATTVDKESDTVPPTPMEATPVRKAHEAAKKSTATQPPEHKPFEHVAKHEVPHRHGEHKKE